MHLRTRPFAQRISLASSTGAATEIEVPERHTMLRLDGYIGSMGYVEQNRSLLESFRTQAPPQESGIDGARVVAIFNAIYLAAARRGSVRLEDVPAAATSMTSWGGRP